MNLEIWFENKNKNRWLKSIQTKYFSFLIQEIGNANENNTLESFLMEPEVDAVDFIPLQNRFLYNLHCKREKVLLGSDSLR